MLAVINKHIDAIRELLSVNADLNIPDNWGDTTLLLAIKNGTVKVKKTKLALVSSNSKEEWYFNPRGSYTDDTPLIVTNYRIYYYNSLLVLPKYFFIFPQ